ACTCTKLWPSERRHTRISSRVQLQVYTAYRLGDASNVPKTKSKLNIKEAHRARASQDILLCFCAFCAGFLFLTEFRKPVCSSCVVDRPVAKTLAISTTLFAA